MALTPTIGRIMDTSSQPCTYSPSDTDASDCGRPAIWHICWDAGIENGLACDEHMTLAQQFVYLDRHRVGPDCAMPGSRWLFDEQRCVVPGSDGSCAAADTGELVPARPAPATTTEETQ